MKSHLFVFKQKKLTVEKDRITLSITQVEKPMKVKSGLGDEQTGNFKRYVLAIIYWLLQYLPVVIKFLLTTPEVNQW